MKISAFLALTLVAGSVFGQTSAVDRAVEAERNASTTIRQDLEAKLRGEIEALLAEMTKHVLDVDIDGYLKLIDPRDVPFVNEQKYWAKDLFRKPAAELKYTLGEEIRTPQVFEKYSVVESPLTIEWSIKNDDGTPGKSRKVSFDARFSKIDGVWKYSGEAWQRYEAEGVIVLFWPGWEELAKGVAEVFPGIKKTVEEGFELTVNHKQEVKLFASMRHLQHSICLSYTDGLGGWNEPGEPIKQLARKGQTGEESKVVLAHEFGHACTFEMGKFSNEMPWWVLEGVAELSAEAYSPGSGASNDKQVRRMAAKGEIPRWDDLARFNEVSKENYGKVYTLGHHMLGYISERFERKGRVAWLKAMAQGKSIDDATKSALGMSFAELDAEWRVAISTPAKDEPKEEAKSAE